jgi:hypothetical protein
MSEQFTFDSDKIVYEVVADEVVLVNLDDGAYYMMDGTAALIWQMLAAGATLAETVQLLEGLYGSGAERIGADVHDFVSTLRANQLLAPAKAAPWNGALPAGFEGNRGKTFTPPALARYTDMANLILMDPISEFDENGWPKRRSFPPAKQ